MSVQTLIQCLIRSIVHIIIRYINRKINNKIVSDRAKKQEERRILEKHRVDAFHLGVRYAKCKNYNEALQQFKKAYDLGLSTNSCKYNMGICYIYLNNYEQAISFIKDSLIIKGARETLATTYIYDGIKNSERAVFLLKMRNEKEYTIGTVEEIKNMINVITVELSNYFIKNFEQLNDDTINVIKDAVEIEPLNDAYIEAIVKYYFNKQHYNNIVYYCEKAYEKFENIEIIRMYGIALKELENRTDEALEIYRKYLKVIPEDVHMRLYVGELLAEKDSFQEVIDIYKDGLDIDDSNTLLRFHLCKTYMKIDEIDNAVIEIQTLIKADQYTVDITESKLHQLLGVCFFKKGMYRISLKQFLLCKNKTGILEYLYRLGEVFISQGEKENAKICWEEIYSIDTTYKDVYIRLT